ncbi:MAG TPA: tetratricopeptide repeat protein [Arachnia sp.]|nr:tetratricopeptide repeat protein [Arachnia sp.]HMT87155.1 tetratricopeptide repeat protein [Arachnia sp.]
MSLVVVTYAAVAAGNLLLRAAGQPELPGYLDLGIGALDRIAARVKGSRENKRREDAITAMLATREFAEADAGDLTAADEAVGRVLASVPAGETLVAAIRDAEALRALIGQRAAEEEAKLLSAPAQDVFRAILGAAVAYTVKTALDSPDLGTLAHQQELRDLAALADELRLLQERMDQIPARTVQLLAGQVLSLNPEVPRGGEVEPSRLLAPTSGAVPFVDRDGLLDNLVRWADDAAAFGIQILGGSGGSGKSRLAVELCRRLIAGRGLWHAGFLGKGGITKACASLQTIPGGRLIVMDYAETRTRDVAKVLTSLHGSATSLEPVRVLLLVRNPTSAARGGAAGPDDPGPWRKALHVYKQEASNQLLDEAACTLLDAASFEAADREVLFDTALRTLPAYLDPASSSDVPATDPSFLHHPDFAQPLYVVMAAYLHLVGTLDTSHGTAGLFEGVLEHEAEYWERTAALKKIELDLTEPELRLLVALSTLTDAGDDNEALNLLGQVDFLGEDAFRRGRSQAWLRQLYPGQNALQWGQLLPDRLGEYLVAQQLVSRPGLIAAALDPGRDPALWVRPFTVLARACLDYATLASATVGLVNELLVAWCERCRDLASGPDPSASSTIIEPLTALVEAIGERCHPEQLLRASRSLGLGNRMLASLALAVDRAAVGATEPDPAGPTRAEALHNYAARLAEVGQRNEALEPAREAVNLYRDLAEANPAAYIPDLAMSLNTYAIRLAEVGQRNEALHPTQEAVNLYRDLAKTNQAAYTPDLAASLNNYANILAEVGQRNEAIHPAREAVNLCRVLADANPAAYSPGLAMSLNNYAVRLAEVGQRDEALHPAEEAVNLYRDLADANPAAYNPDLAGSLNNYAIRLAEVEQRDEALDPAEEAVNLYRDLAETNPAAYTPDLATSLNNYALSLAAVGQRNEALDPAEEAVNLRRVLAEANPAAYAHRLVWSLETLAGLLEATGSPEEAARLRAEADAWRPGRDDAAR